MTEQGVILNRLLDKYENSKHLSEPGTSTRRVMLRVGKKELPEYISANGCTAHTPDFPKIEIHTPTLDAALLEVKQLIQKALH